MSDKAQRLEIRPIPEEEKSLAERGLHVGVRLGWWALLFIGVAWGTLYYRQPIEQPAELLKRHAELTQQKADLEAIRDRQQRRIHWLQNEPDYLAIEARDHLNIKQENETIVRIEP
jgi:cell division protein FtsB